jgi:hypothetical protein
MTSSLNFATGPRGKVLAMMLGMLALLSSGAAFSQAPAPIAEIYTCVDANGRKLTSDRPIAACRDREQRLLNPSGTVKARVGPTLTAKELSQLEVKNKADQAEHARLEEEKRQDRALFIRYPTESVHQKERSEALAHISRVKQTAVTRATDLLEQRTKLADELAFYQKDPSKAPPLLQHQMKEVNEAWAAQGRFLADKDTEAARLNARFAAEQARLAPLWRMASGTTQQ